MSKKIAPSLQELSKHGWNTTYLPSDGYEWLDETDTMWAAATAELRALLAVARAVPKLLASVDALMTREPLILWPGRADTVFASASTRRALARLSRVSGGKP